MVVVVAEVVILKVVVVAAAVVVVAVVNSDYDEQDHSKKKKYNHNNNYDNHNNINTVNKSWPIWSQLMNYPKYFTMMHSTITPIQSVNIVFRFSQLLVLQLLH